MINANANIKKATLEVVITRADGTVEDLGVVSEYSRPSWLKRLYSTLILKTDK